jgi:hypothetical protein
LRTLKILVTEIGYFDPGSLVKMVSNQMVSSDMRNVVLPVKNFSFLQDGQKAATIAKLKSIVKYRMQA